MAWVGVITTAGKSLITSCIQNSTPLSIDSLKAGAGTYANETEMKAATALKTLKDGGAGVTTGSQTLVESKTSTQGGIQFRMRVGPAPTAVGTYTLTEIGLFASTTDGTSTTSAMLAYFQNTTGVGVPLKDSFPDFAYILTTVLAIDTSLTVTLTIDGSSYITSTAFQSAVSDLQSAIETKLNANQGSGNAGKFMTVGNDGGLVPASISMTGATSQSAGTSGLVPAPAAGDQGKYLMGNGTWGTITLMGGATSSAAGSAGLVPAPAAGDNAKYLMGNGTWGTPPGKDYSAGTGLSLTGTTFSLATSGATANTYGPSANVNGTNGTTLSVPQITVDAYGRITSITNRTYTSVNTDTNTTYSAGTGLSLSGTTFSLADSGVTADTYGPSANVNGSNGATISVPQITVDKYGRVTSVTNRTYTSVNTDTNTTYSAGTGLSLSGTSFSLATSGVTAGSYGPSANVNGSDGATISVPQITVDKYGRVTSVTNRTYTSVNTDTNTTYSAGSNITLTGTVFSLTKANVTGALGYTPPTSNTTYSAGNGLSLSGTTFAMSGSYTGDFTATKVYNAVWNDYAECREAETVEGGYCVRESRDGIMKKTTERLMAGCKLTSDTFGTCMGRTKSARTPIAVSGRVLVYPASDPSDWELGAAVCSAPDGKIDIMTREEIREYPERIVGTISEIPDYEFWNAGDENAPIPIKVNGRIWVYVR